MANDRNRVWQEIRKGWVQLPGDGPSIWNGQLDASTWLQEKSARTVEQLARAVDAARSTGGPGADAVLAELWTALHYAVPIAAFLWAAPEESCGSDQIKLLHDDGLAGLERWQQRYAIRWK